MLNGVREQPASVRKTLKGVSGGFDPGATLGETLRFLRDTANLTQSQLGKKSGIANGYISEF